MYKFVYLLQSSESGLYKIGVSKNPVKRIKQLQTGNAEKISMINSYKTDIPFILEKSLKNFYITYHVKGEWFKLSIEQELEFLVMCEKINKNIKLLKENDIFFT